MKSDKDVSEGEWEEWQKKRLMRGILTADNSWRLSGRHGLTDVYKWYVQLADAFQNNRHTIRRSCQSQMYAADNYQRPSNDSLVRKFSFSARNVNSSNSYSKWPTHTAARQVCRCFDRKNAFFSSSKCSIKGSKMNKIWLAELLRKWNGQIIFRKATGPGSKEASTFPSKAGYGRTTNGAKPVDWVTLPWRRKVNGLRHVTG